MQDQHKIQHEVLYDLRLGAKGMKIQRWIQRNIM